jgi:hypothetical protein
LAIQERFRAVVEDFQKFYTLLPQKFPKVLRQDPLPCSFNCRESSNHLNHSIYLFSFFLSLSYLNQRLRFNWKINSRKTICFQKFYTLLQQNMKIIAYSILRERLFYHLKFRHCGRPKML